MGHFGDGLHPVGKDPSDHMENKSRDEDCLISCDERQHSARIPSGTVPSPLQDPMSLPLIESFSSDAFQTMTFCMSGFEDDLMGMFQQGM